jgi:hypothetical protein
LKRHAFNALKAVRIVSANPSLLRRRQHIFLLSHVRGYTTLMGHILGSHPEISGYAETWLSYGSPLDLIKLRLFVANHGNFKPESRFLFDKILHNRLTMSDSVLRRDDVHCLFIIRRPVPTLKSMVALYHAYIAGGGLAVGCTLPGTVEAALVQYRQRLRTLADIGERLHRLGRHSLVLLADELMEKPDDLLRGVSDFLGLSTPLKKEYSLFARSGAWDRGDTSDFIRKRVIVRPRPAHNEIEVPVDLAEQGADAYAVCLRRLRRWSLLALHLVLVCTGDVFDFVSAASPA